MSYGLMYTVPFAAHDNTPCVVEIEREGYSGVPQELVAGEPPFKVEISDEEFLYTPTRFSTAQIQIVGKDYLRSLFSTDYRQFRVTFKRGSKVTWCGFVKPEVYTQDYSSDTFTLEIECISAMSVLEFLDYVQVGETSKVFVSLWSLLQRCLRESRGMYTSVYIPHVYAKDAASYLSGSNVLADMTVSEQNFFDEEGKPLKMKEVLEEICKLLGWTCADWMGDLYFVDIDHMGEYYQYDAAMSVKKSVLLAQDIMVQNIGFSGANHTLDILPGYNKVTVKCSNYPIGDLLPDEKYDRLKELYTKDDISPDGKRVIRSVYLYPEKWDCTLYKDGKMLGNAELDGVKDSAPALPGCMLMRFCRYDRENDHGTWKPAITDYSYINTVRIRQPESSEPGEIAPGKYKVLSFRGASATYADGAIVIDGTTKIIKEDDMLPWGNSAAGYGLDYLSCQVRIGNMYYGDTIGDASRYVWSENPKNHIELKIESWNNDGSADWVSIVNQKTLDMPYTGARGVIVPIDRPLSGDFEFTLMVRNRPIATGLGRMAGELIQNFTVKYKKKDGITEDNNADRIYENILNESYINELDDIELKMSSYNSDGACYSKVMLSGEYLADNLYNAILKKNKRPEEMLISRIISHYESPRIKLTEIIKAVSEINPITRLSDKYLVNKKFINAGGYIDYQKNKFSCVMIEV